MGKLFLFYQYTIIKLYSVVTENKETARKKKKKRYCGMIFTILGKTVSEEYITS